LPVIKIFTIRQPDLKVILLSWRKCLKWARNSLKSHCEYIYIVDILRYTVVGVRGGIGKILL
jgi:hypothetical protein